MPGAVKEMLMDVSDCFPVGVGALVQLRTECRLGGWGERGVSGEVAGPEYPETGVGSVGASAAGGAGRFLHLQVSTLPSSVPL